MTQEQFTFRPNHWNSFKAMVMKEFTIMTRYPISFLSSFLQIFLIIGIFVMATLVFVSSGGQSTEEAKRTGYFFVVGFIMLLFISSGMFTVGMSVRQEQYQGTLESLVLTPSRLMGAISAKIVPEMVWTALNCIVGYFFICFLYGQILPIENVFLVMIAFLLSLGTIFGIGFLIAGLSIAGKESINQIVNLLQFIVFIFCALFFPFSVLPLDIQMDLFGNQLTLPGPRYLSYLIPYSYPIDLIRSLLMGLPPGYPELLSYELLWVVTGFMGLIFPLLGYWVLLKSVRKGRMKGDLAKF